ncbi:MAG TPA: CocE/NonD family hydrolase [Solimonas sp.]|nr:CocE/NonD family hydrolase [Solimonas sp.]
MFTLKRIALVLALLALPGCGIPGNIDPPKDSAAAPAATPKPERALADYLHDLSPRLEGVTAANAILEHYSIPAADGTVLDGWVRRPPGDERQPAVIVFSPYYGGGDPSLPVNLLGDPSITFAEFLVPRGYAVGFVSVAGTGNSGGCFRDGGPIERRQLADAVQYLASQRWSNGAIGAIGVSYDGTTANELFVEAPPALKTVVPMESITDYYRYSFNNGIVREDTTFFTTYYYPTVGLSPAGLEGGVGPSDPPGFVQELVGEACPEQLAIQRESIVGGIVVDKTPYWHDRDAIELVLHSLDRPRPSMFYIQGLEDANVDGMMAAGYLEAVAQTGVPLHVWFGQWVHEYPESSNCAALAPCRGDFFELALLAWFDQFLKGRDTGILDAPAVQLQADDGVWRHEEQWPPAVAQAVQLFPSAQGGLAEVAGEGSASYTDAGPNQTTEANTGTVVPFPVSAGTFVEFASAPLAAPLRLTGLPRLVTVATSSAPRANLVATLLARSPDGSQRFLNFASINLNHAATLDRGGLDDISGLTLPVDVGFFPQDNVVPAGAQLVLHIGGDVATERTSSGNATNLLNFGPSLLPVGAGAEVVLDLAQTHLSLPVNPGDRVEPLSWLPAGE